MAGNRGREHAIQIPLLMELSSSEPISSHRGESELKELRERIIAAFDFEPFQIVATVTRKQNKLKNEVDWAFDQLEARKEACRGDSKWKITPQGNIALKQYFCGLFRNGTSSSELDALLSQKDDFGRDFLVAVLRAVPPSDLTCSIANASDRVELFLLGWEAISSEQIGGVIADFWEVLLPIVIRDRRRAFPEAFATI